MSDISEMKSVIINDQLREQAMASLIISSTDLLVSMGVSGIQEVANQQPQAILDALDALKQVIQKMQEKINALVEHELTIMDIIEKTAEENPQQ